MRSPFPNRRSSQRAVPPPRATFARGNCKTPSSAPFANQATRLEDTRRNHLVRLKGSARQLCQIRTSCARGKMIFFIVQDVRDEACLELPDDQGRASPCAPRRTPSAAAPILRTPFGPSPSLIPGRGWAGLSANGSQNVVLCWFRLRQPCFRPLPSMFHLSSALRPRS